MVKKVIIYNASLLNAILHFCVKFGLHVEQKYLECGLTQMECAVYTEISRKSLSIPHKIKLVSSNRLALETLMLSNIQIIHF